MEAGKTDDKYFPDFLASEKKDPAWPGEQHEHSVDLCCMQQTFNL